MATRDTEGRREIEAAKQRLSAAKSHVTFLSKTLATAQASEDAAKKAWKKAKKNREDIQAQAADLKKELAEAKKFLAEAEQRWEVISIDDTPQKTSSKNKKRKVSTSAIDQKVDIELFILGGVAFVILLISFLVDEEGSLVYGALLLIFLTLVHKLRNPAP